MRYFAVAVGLGFAAAMFASGAAKAEDLKNSDGKCWVNSDKSNYKWGDCAEEKKVAKAKGTAKSKDTPKSNETPKESSRGDGGGKY